jgi:superfamily II DNA or RNA helicase
MHRDALTLSVFDIAERETTEYEAYRELRDVVEIPRVYAAQHGLVSGIRWNEGASISAPELPQLRPNQRAPVGQVLDAFSIRKRTGVVLEAFTGSGKTVMGCYIAAQLRTATLILVDQEKLMHQWRDTLIDLFGYRPDEIGVIRGKIMNFATDFTIGMVQSIYDRELPPKALRHFGMVIFDEVHVCGAVQFSNVLEMFPARYRLGLSATPDRKDGLDKLLKLHVQEERVVMTEDREQSMVYVMEHDGCYSWYANISPKTGRFVSEVSEDNRRNQAIVRAIKWFWEKDRRTLIIGERIAQLEGLYALAALSGIPEEDMLLYCGEEMTFEYQKNPTPKGHPEGWEPGTLYTPVHLEVKRRKANLVQKSSALRKRKLIFSTYAVFSKGVDVPELDSGIDVSPKTSFVQTHGRILRKKEGKRIPIWATIVDVNSFRAQYQFSKRLAELAKSKVEVFKWWPDRGKRQKADPRQMIRAAESEAKRIKNVKISTDRGGNFTLMTPRIERGSARANGSGTGSRRPRASARPG